MNDFSAEAEAVKSGLLNLLTGAVEYLPQLAAALVVLLLGWIVARIVRRLVNRLGGNINNLIDRTLQGASLPSARLSPGTVAILAQIAFWVVIFVAITIAARTAGVTGVSVWFSELVEHIPNLLIGAVIIVVGHFASRLVGEQVSTAAGNSGRERGALMGRLARAVIFVTALIIGLDQIGVNVTFLVAMFAVAAGTIFLGFSIAFGLGAREFVSNLIGARTARREFTVGQRVKIGEVEGEVLEISATHVAVETADGKALIPAQEASVSTITVLSSTSLDGDRNG
jgi:small-conductance mechanosensitive channel